MKSLPQAILDEQIKNTVTPAVKVEIQAYGYPAEVSLLKYAQYDWHYVYHNATTTGIRACCPSDDSLVFFNGTTTTRFATPSPDTDFTSLGASGTPSFHHLDTEEIIANPTSNEVMAFRWDSSYVQYKQSTDYGTNFGGWTNISGTITTPTFVRATYKTNGDIFLLAREASSLKIKRRISGTWETAWSTVTVPTDDAYFDLMVRYYYIDGSYNTAYGWTYGTRYLRNIEVAYDDGYFITFNWWQSNIGEGTPPNPYGRGSGWIAPETVTYRSAILYATFHEATGWAAHGQTSMADATTEIMSLQNLQNMTTSMSIGVEERERMGAGLLRQLQGYRQVGQTYVREYEVNAIGDIYPYSFLIKIPNISLIMSVNDSAKTAFFELQGDLTIDDGTFSKAYSLQNVFPLAVCANSEYVFAYNGNQIFISPLPTNWTYPVVGTGAGEKLELSSSKIVNIRERVSDGESNLDIVLDNSDSYFDSPGAGDLSVLAIGSRINLYLGFTIADVATTTEYARYFVDTWEYTRSPNEGRFALHCVAGWGLLNKYSFPRRVRFNQIGHETDYTLYAVIEMLVKSIGGTLTYVNRSSYMTSFYPEIDIQAGESVASLLHKLLALVPDELRFFGNDATITYPQTTDSPIYFYASPS